MHLLYELSYPRSVHCVGKGKPIEGNSIFLVGSIYTENLNVWDEFLWKVELSTRVQNRWFCFPCSHSTLAFVAICYNFVFIQFFFSMTLSFSAQKTTVWNIPDLVWISTTLKPLSASSPGIVIYQAVFEYRLDLLTSYKSGQVFCSSAIWSW